MPQPTARFRVRPDPQPALSYLKHSPLLAVARQLMALETDLRQIQPTLALRPVKLDRQVLTVTAESAAVAARVRQFEPSLLAGLRARGWLVNRVRFRAGTSLAVNGAGNLADSGRSGADKAPVGDRAIAAVEWLRTTLQDSPRGEESPFGAALADFLSRQRGYRR